MGQLTNLYVSSSYQGLLKMTNSATGVTSTLQTVQTGDGTNTPLQISQTEVNISGSLTINGSPVTNVNTSSFVSTSSFNAYTSSNDSKVNSLIAATGSYVTEAESGSFMTTGSVAGDTLTFTKGDGSQFSLQVSVNTGSLPAGVVSGSAQISALGFATTSSLDSLSGSIATTDLAQNNRLTSIEGKTGSYATTGSNNFVGQQNINGSVNVTGSVNITGTVTATSASFQYVTTTYETASVIYSSGSNQFGDASNDTQTLYGTVNLPNGPLVITGSVTSTTGFNGNLTGTASYSTNNLSSSHAINADTASYFSGTIPSSSYATNAATASIAYDVVVYGKCDNPGGLTKGTVVRITGANGDNPLFDSASWSDESTSANVLGMLSADVAYNGFANVVVVGTVTDINTNAYAPSTLLYLSSSGQYTSTVPTAPSQSVRLGQVLRQQTNNGSMYFRADNGYELDELHNVLIATPQQGDILSYVSGSYGLWENKTNSQLGIATTGSVNQKLDTGSFNTYTSSNDTKVNDLIAATASFVTEAESGSFMTTGSVSGNVLTFTKGNGTTFNLTVNTGSIDTSSFINTGSAAAVQNITGSLISSGSLVVTGSLSAKGSIDVRSGSLSTVSTNTITYTNYLSSSEAGNSNIIKGWGDNPASGGPGATQANYTGSLRVTGSNNIFSLPQLRATGNGLGTDLQGYISGSDNTIASNASGIYLNTGSLLFPKVANNYIGGTSFIGMNFTTSSLAGGHPTVTNNTLYAGGVTLNSNSGSVILTGNLLNGGVITSTQNFVTNTRPTIGANIVAGAISLNHISSSINYQTNLSNSPLTVLNHLSSSNITNNSLTINSNTFLGGSSATGPSIWVSGSQSSNATRNIIDNLIGGKSIIISSSFVSSSASNLVASLIYGQNLTVSGSHSTTGGSAFVGRYNDATSLHLAQDIVFAVGTGTGTSTRRTGLWIDSGSNVVTSGSFRSIGNAQVTGSLLATGSFTSIGNVSVTGSIASTTSFGQVTLASNQTVTASSDTTVNFDTVDFDPNSWWNNTTKVFTPTIAGYYEFTFEMILGTGTGTGQVNAQLNKNSGTQALIVQLEMNNNSNMTIQGSKIIYMNGSTDNVKLTFYTSSGSGSQTIQAGAGCVFNIKLL